MRTKLTSTAIIISLILVLSSICVAQEDDIPTYVNTNVTQVVGDQSLQYQKQSNKLKYKRSPVVVEAKKGSIEDEFFSMQQNRTERQKQLQSLQKEEEDKAKENQEKKNQEKISKDKAEQANEQKSQIKEAGNKQDFTIEKKQYSPSQIQNIKSTAMIYDVYPAYVHKKSANNPQLPAFLYRANYENTLFNGIDEQNIGALYTLVNILNTTESRRENGETPLIYASRLGKISAVRFLLVNGANICAQDNLGRTAYQVAKNQKIKDAINTMKLGFNHKDTIPLQ